MDPNKLLEEIRALVGYLAGSEGSCAAKSDAGEQLAEKVQALDEWLSKGGFLPMDWLLALGKSAETRTK